MPMSIKGAIKAARVLEEEYDNDSAFYHYRNPYDYAPGYPDKKATLITKEAELMDQWLELKFGEEEAEKIKENPSEFLEEICKEIYGSLQKFV